MPFCPLCESEYAQGVRRCVDCGSELVESPAEEEGDPDVGLAEVTEAYGEVDAQLLLALLHSHGIDAFLKGESLRYIQGFKLTKLGRVRVLVRADEALRAREIIQGSQSPLRCPHCGAPLQPTQGLCPLCGKAIEELVVRPES